MAVADEKKQPQGCLLVADEAAVVWRVRQVPGGVPFVTQLRIEADSRAARELLGDLDVHGHEPVQVVDRCRTVERDAQTGAFHTTGLTLLLSRAETHVVSADDAKKPAVGGVEVVAEIVVSVQANGHARVVSTCMGLPDCSYPPLPDWRSVIEVGKLLGELRSRLALSRY